ncbi:MAG: Trk system potassium transporter TrkA [Acidobacteriota bacterium]
MKAVVVGGGLVGSTLAEKLSRDGHDVMVVEQDQELIADLNEKLDVQTINGNGATIPVLMSAGIESADLLLATTDSDEANMVVALVGSVIFKVPRVAARLRDPGHEEGFRRIAREPGEERVAINPDQASVEKILSLLPVPGAVDVVSFSEGKLLVAGFHIKPDSEFSGLLLSHLRLLFPATPMLVVAIRRDGRWRVPYGDDEIRAGDLVYFAMDPSELDNVLVLLGQPKGAEKRVMIAGATRIGIALAKRLEEDGVPVTLIDDRRPACDRAAAELSDTLVVHGSPTDRELLREEGADRVTGFVACTDSHEENVVACLLAGKMGAAHTFALVDNSALSGLVGDLGIDAIISPRLLSVSHALQFARKGRIKAVAALLEDSVEVFELEAVAGSRLVSSPLSELGLPRGILIVAVQHGDDIFIPGGDHRIEPGDHVIVAAETDMASSLDRVVAA